MWGDHRLPDQGERQADAGLQEGAGGSTEEVDSNPQHIACNNHWRRNDMRSLLLAGVALLAFSATMTLESRTASAVVCADGVVRAGCAGPRGAVVVRKPVAACKWVVVNGVKVQRCV